MVNLTTISQFLSGAFFILGGISLRHNKSTKYFSLSYWALAGASYFWGAASLLPNFNFLLEGSFPVSLSGVFYLSAIIFTLTGLLSLTRQLLIIVKPEISDLVLQISTLWVGVITFLILTHLPKPTLPVYGLIRWNLASNVAVALGCLVGLITTLNAVCLLVISAESHDVRIKLRGFLLAIGIVLLTFAGILQHINLSAMQELFTATIQIAGASLMLVGILIIARAESVSS
ncbi:hypothetical protein KJ596_03205 [Patescibacteria group bacterium]|nr:hypothetical protein [Patescibacteria group bacterium]MBU1868331.1 hypothetical protein [Patescibacteria group bacterium]